MEVYARKPNKRESKILQQWLKGRDLPSYKRAQIILMSADGKKISEIARWVGLSHEMVRIWIQAFNQNGIGVLKPRPRSGRPRKGNPETCKELLYLFEHEPKDFGILKARWTLQDLASVFSSLNGSSVSYVWVKQQLEKIRYSFKGSKLRSQSQDPEYFKKKRL
jgi:transposase